MQTKGLIPSPQGLAASANLEGNVSVIYRWLRARQRWQRRSRLGTNLPPTERLRSLLLKLCKGLRSSRSRTPGDVAM